MEFERISDPNLLDLFAEDSQRTNAEGKKLSTRNQYLTYMFV